MAHTGLDLMMKLAYVFASSGVKERSVKELGGKGEMVTGRFSTLEREFFVSDGKMCNQQARS